MTYSIYWINPVAKVYTLSDPERDGAQIINQAWENLGGSYITTAGWGATLVIESTGVRTWRCVKTRLFSPLRIARRDDGNGVTERASRIRTAGKEMSSSDDSNRLSSQGRGLYR
jgi:hypothetical protein